MILGHWDAIDTQRDYVCAVCWGPLVIDQVDTTRLDVHCAKGADCSGGGFVTRKYAERRIQESERDLIQARMNLRQALHLKSTLTTTHEKDILNELGF